jgi:hypothetical protein
MVRAEGNLMRPADRPGELFAAFSRVIDTAFRSDRLIACPTLSKAPNYGNVLRRFLLGAPSRPVKLAGVCRTAARYLLSNGLHLGFMLTGAILLRLFAWKLPPRLDKNAPRAPGKPLFIVDTFAVLPKVAQDKSFQDIYMPGLAEEAARCGHEVVRLYRLYGSRNPLCLWKAFRALASTHNGLTELHLLTARDWLSMLSHLLVFPFSLCRLIRSLARHPEGSPESAVRDALIHTAGQCVLIGEIRRLAGKRLGLRLAGLPSPLPGGPGMAGQSAASAERRRPPATIVSWYENQTINKCFQRGLSQAEEQSGRHIPVIGAQLFIWPDTLLNNHPDDVEMRFKLTPDRVLVNGPHFLPETTRQAYAVGPSLRYGHLFAEDGGEERAPAAAPSGGPATRQDSAALSLLVLLSYHPDEIRRVLHLALPLAGRGRNILYKFHPTTRPGDFNALLPPAPTFAAASLKDALRQCDAVLGSGSGALAEAASRGVFVLNAEDPSGLPGLSLNYLPAYGEGSLWTFVRSSEDVEKALRGLRESRARGRGDEGPGQSRVFRDLLFTEPTPRRIREAFGLERG